MGVVVKISQKTKPKAVQKTLKKLAEGKKGSVKKKLVDFYGALPSTYGDGMIYQRSQRDEWK